MAEISRKGLSRCPETATKGMAQTLFKANVANAGGSGQQMTFANLERLEVRGILGRGKYGNVDEVECVDFPGELYALKTIKQVSCVPVL